MKSATLLAIFLLILPLAPTVSEAIVYPTVTIQGTKPNTTAGSLSAGVQFTDSAGNPAVALACTTLTQIQGSSLCSRTFFVGTASITIKDVSTTNRARVYAVDGSSSDILNVAGLLAVSGGSGISLSSPVTLTINYASGTNQYAALNYNLYPYTAATSGNFIGATGGNASACNSTTPCFTLKLIANSKTVNTTGVATVSVPPISSTAFNTTLNPPETLSVACGTSGISLSCHPSLNGAATAVFGAASETLKVTGGAAIGGSKRPVWGGGTVDNFVDIVAPESPSGLNTFIDYAQEPTLHATLVGCPSSGNVCVPDGGSINNTQNMTIVPLAWDVFNIDVTVPPTQTQSITLKSIISDKDTFNDGAHLSFLPTPGQTKVREISSIVLDYSWLSGDCSNSWYVAIELADLPLNQSPKIFLGDPSGNFLTTCTSNYFNTVELTTFPGANVQLPDGSFVSYATMSKQFANSRVRSVTAFLGPALVNQSVDVSSLTIVASKTTFSASEFSTPVFDTNAMCDLPGFDQSGADVEHQFLMRFTPVDANGVPTPDGVGFIWGDDPTTETFYSADCQLRADVPARAFPSQQGQGNGFGTSRAGYWLIELLRNTVPVGKGTILLNVGANG